jgi:TatD DNase family protein
MLELIDIGLNLTHDSFDHDRDKVLGRAVEAGVRRFIVTGTSVATSARALELASARPNLLYATAGVHPHYASEFDTHSASALRKLLGNSRVVAVGECGLDYFRDFSPREDQERAFAAQLDLAVEAQLPVFLHQRDAHDDFVRHVARVRDRLPGGVAHCFTGGPKELRHYLGLDLYIGVTGWVCDERRGRDLRMALPDLPLDRLVIETDAPYLLPRDLRPTPRNRRNEPSFLPHILRRVAEEMNRPIEAVAAATLANTEALFGLPAGNQSPLL